MLFLRQNIVPPETTFSSSDLTKKYRKVLTMVSCRITLQSRLTWLWFVFGFQAKVINFP